MPVDFPSLVLSPCMSTFGRAVTIDPIATQPTAAPYPARGVYSSFPVDLQLDDGAVISAQQTTLGVQVNDRNPDGSIMFAVLPSRGDLCTLGPNVPPLPGDGTSYWIADTKLDGQGGATMTLRRGDNKK